MLFFQDQAPSSSNPPMGNDPIAETRERVSQTLLEEVQEKLKEIFAWLQREARDQIRDLDYFEDMLRPISQELPEDVRCDRTAQNNSVLSPKPVHLAIKQ
jgi:hypothetical protein